MKVQTNTSKIVMKLIFKHKIFFRNTLKTTYSCTKNMFQIVTTAKKKKNPKKPINEPQTYVKIICNCRTKYEFQLHGKCFKTNVRQQATEISKETLNNIFRINRRSLESMRSLAQNII